MTETDVAQLVDQLARQAGRSAPLVRWVPGTVGQAHRRHGRDVLTLGRGILDDYEDARFTAAHERGHVLMGHTEVRSGVRIAGGYVGSAAVVMVCGTLPACQAELRPAAQSKPV